MELSIIHKVSQLINSHKAEAALGIKKGLPARVKGDTVDVSDVGSEIQMVKSRLASLPERGPDRQEKIDKIKEAVETRQYRMSEELANLIAEKIARSLI